MLDGLFLVDFLSDSSNRSKMSDLLFLFSLSILIALGKYLIYSTRLSFLSLFNSAIYQLWRSSDFLDMFDVLDSTEMKDSYLEGWLGSIII